MQMYGNFEGFFPWKVHAFGLVFPMTPVVSTLRTPFNPWKNEGFSTPNIWVTYLANGYPFKLLGIPYFVGKIKFKLFFQGPLAK